MDKKLDFKFVAIGKNSFTMDASHQQILITYDRTNSELFTSKTINNKAVTSEEIELHSLSRDHLLELCDTFPKTAAVLQEYAIQQIMHLDQVRRKKKHLHPGNFTK